jgi:tetratricopeptide (TPR) repeat protein
MVEVLGPERDVQGARAVAQEAIAADADPVAIEQALAEAARVAGDNDAAETALIQESRDAPTFSSMMDLGGFYIDTRKYDRAALAYQRAVEIDPTSARAYFSLAQAEEGSFDFAAANRDYAHAVELAPNEEGMRQAYRDFQQRVAQAHKQTPGG